MTIVEFLTARLAEDEAMATSTPAYQHVFGIPHYFHANSNTSVAMNPRVARAEIAAKRAIMTEHSDTHECSGPRGGLTFDPALQEDDWGGPCNTLRYLALPYAEHRDFDRAWKVDA